MAHVIQHDSAANNLWVAAKFCLPQRVTQNNEMVLSGYLIVGSKHAAQPGRDPQQRKHVGGNLTSCQPDRLSIATVDKNLVERSCSNFGLRKAFLQAHQNAFGQAGLSYHDQLFRMSIRQWLKKYAV